MMSFLHVINIISFILVIILGIPGVVYEILGHQKFEKILENLHIPLSIDSFIVIGWICTAVLIISYILRKKFYN